MKRTLALGLAALAACSSAKKEKPIVYAAPQPATATETTAIADAQTTLGASLTFVAPTQPTTGGPGLADQLAASLGGYSVSASAPELSAAKLAQGSVRQAFDTGGMDPACVTTEQVNGVTTVRWGQATPCTISTSDPTTSITVGVTGWLSWNPATGVTSWDVGETYDMSSSSSGQAFSMRGTAAMSGSMTVSAAEVAITSESDADVTTSMTGMTIPEQVKTTLQGTLPYEASPFCVVSGSLVLEQRMSAMGMDQAEGWRFDWSGCGAFTVAHGS